jgi:hypothetical protein
MPDLNLGCGRAGVYEANFVWPTPGLYLHLNKTHYLSHTFCLSFSTFWLIQFKVIFTLSVPLIALSEKHNILDIFLVLYPTRKHVCSPCILLEYDDIVALK